MKAGGAIITARIKGEKDQVYTFCKSLKYFTMAESLGGIESLICHPATMTHASVDAAMKEHLGIDDGLVRFSIGCEDLEDLRTDLNNALNKLL